MNLKLGWTTASIASVAALAAAPAFGQILTASCLDNSVPLVVDAATAACFTAASTGQKPAAACFGNSVPLVVEEARLSSRLPDNANPAVLQSKPFAQQMIEGAGFQDFGPEFVNELCGMPKLKVVQNLVLHKGEELWHMAVDRAQQRVPTVGDLPYSDDRPLYWTRLQVRAALRQWVSNFPLSAAERADLITTFDRASRGMFDIKFPAGKGVKRLIFSGFDPYTLDGGTTGSAPGSVGNNIRHGNPSGATVLASDGTTHVTPDGTTVFIEAYVLPVNYPEFEQGYLEDTVGPWMLPGPRQVNASVTVSQAGPDQFNLEMWNGRYHGPTAGNDLIRYCPAVGGLPQVPTSNSNCDIKVVERWGGPATFNLFNPPQWTQGTLPFEKMIAANTGVGIPRPPGDQWGTRGASAGDPNAFGVIWHTNYTYFDDCTQPNPRITHNSVASYVPTPLPLPPIGSTGSPPTSWPAVPPDPTKCSNSGGGGNYLSNESAYRNTLLRDRMGLNIPAGHIHTPDMNTGHFATNFLPSDSTFDAWRLAIVHQGQNLIHVVGDNAP